MLPSTVHVKQCCGKALFGWVLSRRGKTVWEQWEKICDFRSFSPLWRAEGFPWKDFSTSKFSYFWTSKVSMNVNPLSWFQLACVMTPATSLQRNLILILLACSVLSKDFFPLSQCLGSVFICSGSRSSILVWIPIRIWIRSGNGSSADPGFWWPKMERNLQLKK